MYSRSVEARLATILVCIDDISNFTKHHSFETFLSDKMAKVAVLRTLEVLGEAANKLPNELRERYPQVEWGRIIRSRNDYDYQLRCHMADHQYALADT